MEEKRNKILLVEDEDSMARLISFKLEKEGYKTDLAVNGEEAVEKFFAGKKSYSVIILDLMLPILDGLQVLKMIRKEDKKTPIIILSAKSQEKDILEGFKIGADDYLTKPFSPDELTFRVKKLFEKWNTYG